MAQKSNQSKRDTWSLYKASQQSIPGGCAAAKPAPQTRTSQTPRVMNSGAARHQDGEKYPGAAQPPSRLHRPGRAKHPESRTRGLHVIKTAKQTRELRSRQAGSADPDESNTPSHGLGVCTSTRRQNKPGGCATAKPAPQTWMNNTPPRAADSGAARQQGDKQKRKTRKSIKISTRLSTKAGPKFGG